MSIITFSPSSAIKNVCLVATTTGQIELRSIADGDLEKGFNSLISNEVLFYIPKFYMGMFARNIKMLWDHAKQEHDNKTSNPLTLTFGAKGTLEGDKSATMEFCMDHHIRFIWHTVPKRRIVKIEDRLRLDMFTRVT